MKEFLSELKVGCDAVAFSLSHSNLGEPFTFSNTLALEVVMDKLPRSKEWRRYV